MALHVSICSTKGIKYVRVCESYRNEKGEPRTKTLESHGQLKKLLEQDPQYVEKLRQRVAKENLALKQTRLRGLETKAKERIVALERKLKNAKSEDRTAFRKFNVGIALLHKVWKDLSMPKLYANLSKKTKIEYSYNQAVFLLSAKRILDPSSKLRVFESKEDTIVPMDQVNDLNQLYRVLDCLDKDKKTVVRHMNREIGKKLKRRVELAFYDVTTYAFESQSESQMKGFGISKDHKVNEVQVVLGLVIDENGIPLDYELFRGNTNEFGTMLPIIARLKKDYQIERLIVVADRGLNSAENLIALRNLGCDFVIAQKIKNCEKDLQRVIFDETNWTSMQYSDEGEVLCKFKRLEMIKELYETKENKKTGRRYKTKNLLESMPVNWVVTYSAKRAQKDIKDLERSIEKAQRALQTKTSITNRKGFRSLIKIQQDTTNATLDDEKIIENRLFAGYYAVCTNLQTKSPESIMGIYRKLWQIEDCFRVSKTQLETRPCFVWTDGHIRGHFLSCYISLVIEKYMLYELKKAFGKEKISAENFCRALQEAEILYDNSDMQTPLMLRLYESELFDKMCTIFGLEVLNRVEQPYMVRRKLHLGSLNV